MSEREKELTRQVEDLKREMAALRQETAAVIAGNAAANEELAVERDAARDEAVLMRHQRDAALTGKAETQVHLGQVYRRIKDVAELVTAHEKNLPKEFVAQVRALVEPDFAQLLGVAA
ncbi:hypothetical protein [Micromonospora sp. NPDC005652]|uniref:hypothetical protein n=1 Tax=Micromonospora sp. NPDC005652 TaxID=3157046 RepID=UPI0033D63B92